MCSFCTQVIFNDDTRLVSSANANKLLLGLWRFVLIRVPAFNG